MLCHLSETLFPFFFFRLLLVLRDSAQRSIVRGTDFLLEMCFFCEPRHTVFRPPGWRWVPTLFSNPIFHLPSGMAEGLNFVVRGKLHIHIPLQALYEASHLFSFLSGEPSLGALPHAPARGAEPAAVWVLCQRPRNPMGSFGQANRAGGWEKSIMVLSLSHTLQSCFTVMKLTSSMLSHFLDLLLNWFASQRGEGN